jgi:triosephosphate isomerase
MRRPIISANWKANQGEMDDRQRLVAFLRSLDSPLDTDVTVHPPYTALVAERKLGNVALGSQDCSRFVDGAYTGEITCEMLRSFGVRYVILGHSERRGYAAETDAVIAAKLARAVEAGLIVILCCGEDALARDAGLARDVVAGQVSSALEQVGVQPGQLVVAYEPIWAIGAGKPATPEEAQEMCGFIRSHLAELAGESAIAEQVRLQYGGSVSPSNVSLFADCQDLDGVLVGGASLKPETFLPLVEAFAGSAKSGGR